MAANFLDVELDREDITMLKFTRFYSILTPNIIKRKPGSLHYKIRPIKIEEIPKLIELKRKQGTQDVASSFYTWYKLDPEGIGVAVTNDGQIIGSLAVLKFHEVLYFGSFFYVANEYRKSGVGSESELIISNGYPLENYEVETKDGYLLSLQRIPHGRKEQKDTEKRPALLLVHCAVSDSIVYVWNFPDKSLGFILADNGYDVWLGNMRGNTYSRRHINLSANQKEFWDFSLDTKSAYDLPAMIDFILNKTGRESLSYVGYSEGTTVAFALLSQNPVYNKKINLFAAYAPAVFTANTKGLIGLFLESIHLLEPIYKKTGFVKFLPHSSFIEVFSQVVCGSFLRFICAGISYAINGYNPKQLNHTRLPVYFNLFPAGDSMKVFAQYTQIRYSGKFQMYDYHDLNMEYYNQTTPPEYELSKITTPVAIYSGINDIVSHPIDVQKLRGKLKSVVEDYIVSDPMFNHLDFVSSVDAYSLVHKKLLTILGKYGKS